MLLSALAGKWKPGYIFGPAVLLFLLLLLRFVSTRFHSSNWLVRANETGLFAQYRSYLNYQLPADQPSVVFIPYGEIASARLVASVSKHPARIPVELKRSYCDMRTRIVGRHHAARDRLAGGTDQEAFDAEALVWR